MRTALIYQEGSQYWGEFGFPDFSHDIFLYCALCKNCNQLCLQVWSMSDQQVGRNSFHEPYSRKRSVLNLSKFKRKTQHIVGPLAVWGNSVHDIISIGNLPILVFFKLIKRKAHRAQVTHAVMYENLIIECPSRLEKLPFQFP